MSILKRNLSQYLLVFSLVLGTHVVTQAQSSGNLLLNPSFEEGVNVGGFKTLREGDIIPGWEVMKATVDLTGSYFTAFDGKYSIDMNGTPGLGAIEQRFFTKKGKNYLLTFYLAGNPMGRPKIKKLMVHVGKQSQLFEFDITGHSTREMGWRKCELVFKATDRKTTLRFESLPDYEPTDYGPAIDMVSVFRTNQHTFSSGNRDGGFFQLNYGLMAGASLYFSGDNTLELLKYNASNYNLGVTKTGVGMHLGAYAELFFGPVFIRPELRVNSNKIDYTLYGTSNQDASERYQYIDIPLFLGFQYKFLKFFVGPTGHLYLFKTSSLDDLGDFETGIRRFTYGYEMGIGADLSLFTVDIRYAGNLDRFGDGLMFNGKNRIYLTDQPDRLILTVSVPLNN